MVYKKVSFKKRVQCQLGFWLAGSASSFSSQQTRNRTATNQKSKKFTKGLERDEKKRETSWEDFNTLDPDSGCSISGWFGIQVG
jgi:hypothetical protein